MSKQHHPQNESFLSMPLPPFDGYDEVIGVDEPPCENVGDFLWRAVCED